MNPRRLTVLLPVLNGMPYLPEALASLEEQTEAESFVFAWDNGSVDGSVDVLKEWIPRRLPGKVVTDHPLSLGDSRGEMLRRAETEFCACMDADDISLPQRFVRQIDALMSDERLAAVGGQVETMDREGKPYSLKLEYPVEDLDIVHRMLTVTAFAHPAVCFRRSAVLDVGNYRNLIPEDYDLWLRLAAKYRVCNLEEKVLRYRFHEKSTSQTGKPEFLPDAVNRIFAAAATALYGCSEAELLDLRRRHRLFAAPLLMKIARHLSRRDGLSLTNRLRTDSFREAIYRVVGPQDLATRLGMALFRPGGPRLIYREARQVIQEFIEWQYR